MSNWAATRMVKGRHSVQGWRATLTARAINLGVVAIIGWFALPLVAHDLELNDAVWTVWLLAPGAVLGWAALRWLPRQQIRRASWPERAREFVRVVRESTLREVLTACVVLLMTPVGVANVLRGFHVLPSSVGVADVVAASWVGVRLIDRRVGRRRRGTVRRKPES